MDKNILVELINNDCSIQDISNAIGLSKAASRYWMKKYGLKTKLANQPKRDKCLTCETSLKGNQRKFCCNVCKSTYNNFNANDGKGYQTYENQKKRGYDRKREFIQMKGGSCQSCGYNKSLRALTFHHRDPTQKSFTLDIRKLSNHTYEKCLKEVEKCDLLCFNCHMELHELEDGCPEGT